VAALGGKLHAVKALLGSEKVDPFALDHEGNTALHYATLAYDQCFHFHIGCTSVFARLFLAF
jgi:hypothetical protein